MKYTKIRIEYRWLLQIRMVFYLFIIQKSTLVLRFSEVKHCKVVSLAFHNFSTDRRPGHSITDTRLLLVRFHSLGSCTSTGSTGLIQELITLLEQDYLYYLFYLYRNLLQNWTSAFHWVDTFCWDIAVHSHKIILVNAKLKENLL